MKERKVRGLIIQEAPMGDKDKRLVMLTRELGKISVIAKGALSPKSKWAATSQAFCYGDYVVSKGQTFYYIKEAQLIESFFSLRQNLDRLAYATFMLEVAETMTLDGTENQELMRLLLRGLLAMSKAEEGLESLVADAFVWRVLAENGFYPDLDYCRRCERDMNSLARSVDPAKPEIVFDFALGGLICGLCHGSGSGTRLSSGALRALRYILEVPQEKVFSFTAQEDVKRQLDEVCVGYLLHQTEKRYNSLDFIANLKR